MIYLNDMFMYRKSEEKHQEHLSNIMAVLEKEKYYGNLKKCTFLTNEVTFLGYIVTLHGIKAYERKSGGHSIMANSKEHS